MNFRFLKPIFTNITSILNARTTNQFVLSWVYPSNFLNQSGTPTGLNGFKLYRHIEVKYPAANANGGPDIDPISDLSSISPKPIYKLIATLGSSVTQYTDTLQDLGVHSDEGISFNGSRWVDGIGNDILNDIFYTRRRLFYKIEAISENVPFNSTPFIYITHSAGIECKSTITQVKFNTLYQEGETVWLTTGLNDIQRVSVDPIYDGVNRLYNVWACGNSNTVYCLDGRTGSTLKTYNLSTSQNLGIRVDPSTGDAIVVGNSKSIFRCVLSSGSVQTLTTSDLLKTSNNTGLVLTKENNTYYAWINTYKEKVVKYGFNNTFNEFDKTYFGANLSTPDGIPNTLGISNGPNDTIWTNGHVPVNYNSYYSYQSCYWVTNWTHPLCPGGSDSERARIIAAGCPPWAAVCDPAVHANGVRQECSTVTVGVNVHFLQDIGYVYGIGPNNLNATNGQPYSNAYTLGYPPSSPSVHYYPFTSEADATRVSTGWWGDSVGGGPACNFPYTGSHGSGSPGSSPNPPESQRGLVSDLPTDSSLVGSTYNVWQTNQLENNVHALQYNGSTLSYTGSTWNFSSSQPSHISIDSENKVWVLCNADNRVYVIHQNENNTIFPYGGNSRWPTLSSTSDFGVIDSYVYGDNYNDPYIEYYLTRNAALPSISSLPLDQRRVAARTWCLSGINYMIPGRRVYPNYTDTNASTYFGTTYNTNEYNSDNTGISYFYAEKEVISRPDYIHPAETYPTSQLKIFNINSTPQSCDGNFWNDQLQNTDDNTAVSGYDNLNVTLSGIVNPGSFEIINKEFVFNDKPYDFSNVGNVSGISININQDTVNYTFHEPSLNGKPSSRWAQPRTWEARLYSVTGQFNPYLKGNASNNPYYVSGNLDSINTTSPYMSSGIVYGESNVSATVWERWPTANFWTSGFDTPITRFQYLTSWNLTAYNYSVTKESNILIGYDPLSAQFIDASISRTWPISSWHWVYGDNANFGGFALETSQLEISALGLVDYHHVTSEVVTNRTPTSEIDTCENNDVLMAHHLYKGPGTYTATLYVQASNTSTQSMQISDGITNQTLMTWTPIVSTQIRVLEVCPDISFNVTAGVTVSSNYNDDNPGSTTNAYIRSDYNLISGYSPNLTVSLTGSISPRSLPVSATWWNFNDYYNDTPNSNDYTLFPYPTAGWPRWNSYATDVTGNHTFVMPGYYDVSLVGIPSANFIPGYVSNCSAGYLKNMLVYVEEIDPVACFSFGTSLTSFGTALISGVAPMTVYFNPSCTVPGSFKICRVEWDFGDGSSHLLISRLLSGEYVNYYNSSAYSDLEDPRNIIVNHTYSTIMSFVTATAIVYACNTDTTSTISHSVFDGYTIDGSTIMTDFSNQEGEVHLISNRVYDNNTLLTFETSKNKKLYTNVIAGNI